MTAYATDLPDFTDLIRATASALAIPAPIIERGYYLTRALFFLSRDHAGRFLLKGGTSLTKGWDLLDRFSEDLDLLLKVESEGRPLSKGERERRLKAMCATISGAPGFSAVRGRFPVETGVHRIAEFIYPGSVEDLAGLSKAIRLEIGTRGGAHPSVKRTVLSMVAKHAASPSLSTWQKICRHLKLKCWTLNERSSRNFLPSIQPMSWTALPTRPVTTTIFPDFAGCRKSARSQAPTSIVKSSRV